MNPDCRPWRPTWGRFLDLGFQLLLNEVASSVPESVICLISALVFYGLTDQVMREIWLAVPHKSHPPKRPNTRIVRMRNTDLGKIPITLGEYCVQIFDRERCIVDAFRYLSKEIAIKALQRYFQNQVPRPDPRKLGAYAKKLRVNIAPLYFSLYNMTPDIEKSFKAKLRAIAKEKNRDPSDLWQSLTLERFLVRLAKSEYSKHFVLKGGILLSKYIEIGSLVIQKNSFWQRNWRQSSIEALLIAG